MLMWAEGGSFKKTDIYAFLDRVQESWTIRLKHSGVARTAVGRSRD